MVEQASVMQSDFERPEDIFAVAQELSPIARESTSVCTCSLLPVVERELTACARCGFSN
jgi:hypothetical protein